MKIKYFTWIPAVMIMGIIFYFSSKPDTESNESSLVITKTILNTYENIIGRPLSLKVYSDKEEMINHIVRKGAHFTEYAILAMAIAFHLWILGMKRRLLFLLPILIAGFYAAADEFHQTFIPGRSGQISDVILDTCGAAAGTLLFSLFIFFLYSHIRKPV